MLYVSTCEHCSAAAKTSLCYPHYFQHKSKAYPVLATVKKINSIPDETSTELKCHTEFWKVGD